MRKIFYSIVWVTICITSCKPVSTETNNEAYKTYSSSLDKYEIELISKTIKELTQPQSPPIVVHPEKKNSTKSNGGDDSLVLKNDTAIFSLYLLDTLIVPLSEIENLTDTMYNGLAHKLISTTLKEKAFNISVLGNLTPYKLLKTRPKEMLSTRGFGFIGSARYSRIIFNEDYTQALFYFDLVCGRLCGYGYLILAEKRHGRWVITRKDMIWIS